MSDRLPSLKALCIFEAAGRHHGYLPRTVEQLRKCTLIHHPFMSWAEWLKNAEEAAELSIPGPHFSEYPLAMQAALSGQGVMLANSIMISAELASGQLVRVLQDQPMFRQSSAYYIVFPESRILPSKAHVFCDWLLEQAHQSVVAKPDT